MKKYTTSDRLKYLMATRDLKQADIIRAVEPFCKKHDVKFGKSILSQYISGGVEPGQEKLTILGMALGVSEVWLMGYDVPMDRMEIKHLSSQAIKSNVKGYREELKLTRTDLAELTGLSEDEITNIEEGKATPTKEQIFLLCDVLNVTPDFLGGEIVELLENGDLDAEYRYLKHQRSIPLSNQESELLALFRKLPADAQKAFLEMARVYSNSIKKH